MKKIAYEDNKNVIHARLRYYRKLRGLTQEQLVAKLQVLNVNIDQQMLMSWPACARFSTSRSGTCWRTFTAPAADAVTAAPCV